MTSDTWLSRHGRRILRLMLVAVLIAAIALLIAYAPALRKRTPHVIVISKTTDMSIAFWWSINGGLKAAAQEQGATMEYRAPQTDSQESVSTQVGMLYQAIAEKPDAIILAAIDAGRLEEPARVAVAAGIPLVMMDSNIASGTPKGSCFVATGNVAAGRKAGEAMAGLLAGGRKIAIVAHVPGSSTAIDREAGVREGLGSGYVILPTLDSGGSSEAAYQRVSELLRQQPDIAGIVALNEYTTVGAARAIRGASKTREIALVGFDSSMEQVTFLEEGLLSATVIQRPFNMGYLALTRAVDLVHGRKVDAFYDTGSILITRDNMYQEENEKLLFPFE